MNLHPKLILPLNELEHATTSLPQSDGLIKE